MGSIIRVIVAAAALLVGSTGYCGHLTSSDKSLDLDTKKVVVIDTDIDEAASVKFLLQMAITSVLPGPRIIVIDSDGGSVPAGQTMIDIMEAEKAIGVKMVCVVTERAHSMAFNILTHCDVRLASPKSKFVVHKMAIRELIPPYGTRLTAKELRKIADDMDKSEIPYRRDNAQAMHLSFKQYDVYTDSETMWSGKILKRMGYLQGYGEVHFDH